MQYRPKCYCLHSCTSDLFFNYGALPNILHYITWQCKGDDQRRWETSDFGHGHSTAILCGLQNNISGKYLGHIINKSQLDDADIYRERRNIFYRCNMLARRFYSCSVAVKLRLFKNFRLCFYDVALWNNFYTGSFDKLRSAYVKCIKVFFWIHKVL